MGMLLLILLGNNQQDMEANKVNDFSADEKQKPVSLRTLERGLDVLDCFCQGPSKLSLTEVTALTGLNPSTAYRIFATLEKRNYLKRDPETRKYQLGPQLIRLFLPSLDASDLRSIARPHMQKLFDSCNESVSLFVALGEYRLCLERIETTHALRRVINIGERLPINRGAGGKALLAWMPQQQLRQLSEDGLVLPLDELEPIRHRGYAVSTGEREKGVAAIAAPIFDASGQLIASLSISAPEIRFVPDVLETTIPLVVQAAEQISSALGFRQSNTP
jgi:IclR family transcriptional regulator, KDG regulon repressor